MEAWQYLQPVVDVLIPKIARHGLASLSQTEQIVYLVWSYPAAINNGGHASFFYNSYGQFAAETESALQELGASEYAHILSRAIEQFPRRTVPHDIEERNNVFNALPQHAHEVMEACDKQFFGFGEERLMHQLLSYWQARAA